MTRTAKTTAAQIIFRQAVTPILGAQPPRWVRPFDGGRFMVERWTGRLLAPSHVLDASGSGREFVRPDRRALGVIAEIVQLDNGSVHAYMQGGANGSRRYLFDRVDRDAGEDEFHPVDRVMQHLIAWAGRRFRVPADDFPPEARRIDARTWNEAPEVRS